jgi:hypothetical protein
MAASENPSAAITAVNDNPAVSPGFRIQSTPEPIQAP